MQFISWMQVFNFNLSQFFAVGCIFNGFTYYHQVLTSILSLIFLCLGLFLVGRVGNVNVEVRENLFNSALAISYLTLPTITTMVFGMFPCDLLDDGNMYLR